MFVGKKNFLYSICISKSLVLQLHKEIEKSKTSFYEGGSYQLRYTVCCFSLIDKNIVFQNIET